MRNMLRLAIGVATGLLALGVGSAAAQTFTSGSTGADGAFSPTTTTTLALPPLGVFNFTTVNIASGVTVRFTKNAANTPVTILAQGDVTIAGTIDVSGAPGGGGSAQTLLSPNGGRGGPGGFDGGSGANGIVSTISGAGLGPGGGAGSDAGQFGGGQGGGFGTAGGANCFGGVGGPVYGTATLLPLIGGSGGAGQGAGLGSTGAGGGGGGGAILIASSGTITLTGTILATGGTGVSGGSGGAVRLAATTIAGSGGAIDARGGAGGNFFTGCGGVGGAGRVRIEGFTNTAAVTFNGVSASITTQPTVAALPNTPTLRIASVAGVNAPATPLGSFGTPDITLPAGTTSPVAVTITGANIPVGTTVTVTTKGQVGTASSGAATLSGSLASSTASASVAIPTNEPSVISASASFTLLAAGGSGPVYVQGEEVEQVRVTTRFGGPSQVAYVTKSGREIVVTPGR